MSGSAQKLYQLAFGTEARTVVSIFSFVLILGVILGASLPPDKYDPPYNYISSVTGWIYFSAWSVSFYPQVLLNMQRKSVEGLSFDFIALNLVGFSCYSAYNVAYFYNPDIRAAYAAAHSGNMPGVQLNDVFFALHAVLLTVVTGLQIFMYRRGAQSISRLCTVALVLILIAIALVAALVLAKAGPWFSWLNFLVYISYIKLAISIFKYTPQVYLNYRRRSTAGWTIHNVLLDFTGGFLSLGQLLMDCAVSGDWSQIEGDPVKFGLGFASMFFDVIFITQHYFLYPGAHEEGDDFESLEGEETKGLIDDDATSAAAYST